jgi:hypothetical protein
MPYERKLRQSSSSRSRAVLLADLEAGDAIAVTCRGCSHSSLIAPHALLARSHASVAVGAALEKLQCTACGGKEITWTILQARPPRDARRY